MENLVNFKAQMEYENIETRLNSTRLSGKHKSASLRIYYFSSYANATLWLRDMQPKTGSVCVPSSLLAVKYYFKKIKD